MPRVKIEGLTAKFCKDLGLCSLPLEIELDDAALVEELEHAAKQHPVEDAAAWFARAVGRQIWKTCPQHRPSIPGEIKSVPLQLEREPVQVVVPGPMFPRWVVLAWGILVLLFLAVGAARGQGNLMFEVQKDGASLRYWSGGTGRINFKGAGVSCTYNATTDAADCTVSGAPGGGITSLNSLNATTQYLGTPGTSGLAPSWSSVTDTHTLNIPLASAIGVTAGLISKTQYDVFNTKQDALNFGNEEGPAGALDGNNVTFTLNHTPSPATSLKLVYNGLTLRSGAGNDFTISSNTITFLYAPTAGSNLICWYQY